MKAFDIGWIPQGWTKGEELVVNNLAGPDMVAVIRQAPKPFDYSALVFDLTLVAVRAGQESVAQEWLNWWKDS